MPTTIPTINPYTGQVAVPGQPQATFTFNMQSQLTYEANLAPELNATVEAMNTVAGEVETLRDEAQTSATNAETSAVAAQGYANFQGPWSTATGAWNKGNSFNHNGRTWALLVYLPDITAVEPGTDANTWRAAFDESSRFFSNYGAISRSSVDRFSDTINIRDFLIGDGSDERDALRNLMLEVKNSGKNLSGDRITCRSSGTIYIPNLGNNTTFTDLDFGGLSIVFDDGVTRGVEMGRYDPSTGQWFSTMSEPVDTYISQGVTFSNLTVKWDSPVNKTERVGFGFKNYNTACGLKNLTALNCELGFDVYRCFYLSLDTCQAVDEDDGSENFSGTGFRFRDENNLMDMFRLVASGKDRGYEFDGAVTGVKFRGCSFERQNYAIYGLDQSYLYDLTISDCYMEKVRGPYAFYLDGQVNNVTFDNNWLAPLSGDSNPNPNIVMVYSRSNNESRIKWLKSNRLLNIPENQIFDGGVSFDTLALQTTSITDTNLLLRESEYGIGNVVERYAITRDDVETRQVARVVNEIIPSNYSGRVNTGRIIDRMYGLYNPVKSGSTITFDTQIVYSNTQLLHLNLSISDNAGTTIFSGLFYGDEFRNRDGTYNPNVTLINKAQNQTVKLVLDGIDPLPNWVNNGGELRVL